MDSTLSWSRKSSLLAVFLSACLAAVAEVEVAPQIPQPAVHLLLKYTLIHSPSPVQTQTKISGTTKFAYRILIESFRSSDPQILN